MTQRSRYASPAAFRRAVTDRLRANAVESKWSLAQLQRQLAYDRFLERRYLLDDGWIVKGAIALLPPTWAREPPSMWTSSGRVPPRQPKAISARRSVRTWATGSTSRSGLAAPSAKGRTASASR